MARVTNPFRGSGSMRAAAGRRTYTARHAEQQRLTKQKTSRAARKAASSAAKIAKAAEAAEAMEVMEAMEVVVSPPDPITSEPISAVKQVPYPSHPRGESVPSVMVSPEERDRIIQRWRDAGLYDGLPHKYTPPKIISLAKQVPWPQPPGGGMVPSVMVSPEKRDQIIQGYKDSGLYDKFYKPAPKIRSIEQVPWPQPPDGGFVPSVMVSPEERDRIIQRYKDSGLYDDFYKSGPAPATPLKWVPWTQPPDEGFAPTAQEKPAAKKTAAKKKTPAKTHRALVKSGELRRGG